MDEVAARAWRRFRKWPVLAQVVLWFLLPYALVIILVWQARWHPGVKAAATGVLVVVSVVALTRYWPNAGGPRATIPSPDVSPTATTFSEITLTRVELVDDAVVVEGQTDLPETSILRVGLAAEAGEVTSSAESIVGNGQFAANLLPPPIEGINESNSEEGQASYEVEVTFSTSGQPLEVLSLVGRTGGNLKGPLAATDGEFVVLQLRQTVGVVAAPSPSAS